MSAFSAQLTAWSSRVLGQYINEDWTPSNQGYGAQCWDTAASWSKALGLPVIHTHGLGRWPGWAGNMVDAFPQSPAVAAAYQLFPPTARVEAGDILVWDDSYPAWFPATHVAVAVADAGAWLLTISQNSTASLPGNPYPQWTTGPTVRQTLPRRGLIGIIRPRTAGGITVQGSTSEQENEVVTKADMEAIASVVVAKLMTEVKDGNTLGEVIAEARGHHLELIKVVERVPGQVLNTAIPRGGELGGETTLAAVASWHDAHIVAIVDAVASAAGAGADLDAIKAAVLEGLKTGITVDVKVTGGAA